MELRAVIFDLDGVITDTAEYHYRAWQRLADEEGLTFNREINERLRGVSRRASLQIILNGRQVSEERLAEMMERKNNYYVASLANVTPADLCPGAVPLIEELQAAGIKVALGSASKNARTVLEALGIAQLFDVIADGYTVQTPKPAPDLFLKAAEMLGVAPPACAAVEDAAAGIEAARAGGMWSAGIGPAERAGRADVRYDSLDGVTLADLQAGLTAASWTIAEPEFDPARQHHMETVFTTGNGHFCLRGDFEESYPGARPACFMYGLWDDMPVHYTELANLPRWWGLELWVNGVPWRMDRGTVLEYRRWLDLRTGVLIRRVRWQPTEDGPVLELVFERFASLAAQELAVVRLQVTACAGQAALRVRTGFNGHAENTGLVHWDVIGQDSRPDLAALHVRTRATGHELALAAAVAANGGAASADEAISDAAGQPALERRAVLQEGETFTLEKYVALLSGPQIAETGLLGLAQGTEPARPSPAQEPPCSGPGATQAPSTMASGQRIDKGAAPAQPALTPLSRPGGRPAVEAAAAEAPTSHNAQLEALSAQSQEAPAGPAQPDLAARATQLARAARAEGYAALRAVNDAAWAQTWEDLDVVVEGDHEAQIALRFNIFQLAIAAPRWSERASIPAKTLSGFGYRQHVFWDTEIFMLPLFTCAQPELARHMLMYRWRNLPGARAKAAANGYEGAQFPWESAGTGCEVTPVWMPDPADPTRLVPIWTGAIEIHITADIAYAIWQYWQATGDDAWLADYGTEVVLDGAKFWASAARREDDGRYHLRNVIGPDEYHDRVDDNAYTNYLAKWQLQTALLLIDWLAQRYPERHKAVAQELDLSPGRLAQWAQAAERMYLPLDAQSGLIEQFTGYFERQDADIAALRDPGRTQSMQILLGIEGCAETQVLKQPDVLMLQYLLPGWFTPEQVRANYDYYSPRTDHEYGSSLGPSISAIMASRVGDQTAAYEHFMRAARADLRDVRGNAGDGIHGASAGGLWQAAICGFGGVSFDGEGWTTHPRLPAGWTRLAFKFYFKGERQTVDVRA